MYQDFLKQVEEFIFAEDEAKKADVIFVPGNGYPENAERAAKLFLEGMAPFILPSGRFSIAKGKFSGVLSKKNCYTGEYETEWEFMHDVLRKNGVPDEAILKENQATYTYENALLSRKVTDQEGIVVKRGILCCKASHARRAKMYYERVFPEAEILVCPSCVDGVCRENWTESEEGIREVTGEITRIIHQFSFLMEKNDQD